MAKTPDQLAQLKTASRMPRPMRAKAPRITPSGETMDEAVLRYQQAKADTETLDAEKRALDVAKLRRELIPVADAQDSLESVHLQYVAELEQLPHLVIAALPPEITASTCEQLRSIVADCCMKLRKKIGGA